MAEQLPTAPSDLPRHLRETYEWIEAFIRRNDYSPTVREVRDGCGLRSNCPAQCRLAGLRDRGLITWKKGSFRTIRLTSNSDEAGHGGR